jgi:hypothetical protein
MSPSRCIAHRFEHAVVGEVAGRDDLDAGLLEPALLVALDEGDRLAARREEHEDRLRIRVLGALDERRELGILQWRAHAADDLAAARLEVLHELASASLPGRSRTRARTRA